MSVRVFAYGGGVQSTAALVLAVQGKIDYPNFIFVNVGERAENPATLRYVREIAQPYADESVVGMVEISQVVRRIHRKGQLRGDAIDLYDYLVAPELRSVPIPLRMHSSTVPGGFVFGNRGCTHRWKRQVLADALAPYTKTAPGVIGLGISWDEIKRMRNDSGYAHFVNEYPLIDLRLTRDDCIAVIKAAGLPLPPKSSCWFCPFHSAAYWRELRAANPQLFRRAWELEDRLNMKRAHYGLDRAFLNSPTTFDAREVEEGGAPTPDEICDSGYCMV